MKNNCPIYFVIFIQCKHRCINSQQIWHSHYHEVDLSPISVYFTVHYHYINATPIYFHLESNTATQSKMNLKLCVDIHFIKTQQQIRLSLQQKLETLFNMSKVKVIFWAKYFVDSKTMLNLLYLI